MDITIVVYTMSMIDFIDRQSGSKLTGMQSL